MDRMITRQNIAYNMVVFFINLGHVKRHHKTLFDIIVVEMKTACKLRSKDEI